MFLLPLRDPNPLTPGDLSNQDSDVRADRVTVWAPTQVPTLSQATAAKIAGLPIEAVASNETIAVPEDLVGKRDTYVLRVRGDSMIDEQIRDGDFVVVEDRKTADNGEMVIALLRGSDVTLKKFYRDPGGKIRLQPANAAMQPIFADPDQVQIQGVVVGVMRKY